MKDSNRLLLILGVPLLVCAGCGDSTSGGSAGSGGAGTGGDTGGTGGTTTGGGGSGGGGFSSDAASGGARAETGIHDAAAPLADASFTTDGSTTALGSWSCVEAPGDLCFCHTSGPEDGDVPTCTASWNCCFAALGGDASMSCECIDLADPACTGTIAMTGRATRVANCPP